MKKVVKPYPEELEGLERHTTRMSCKVGKFILRIKDQFPFNLPTFICISLVLCFTVSCFLPVKDFREQGKEPQKKDKPSIEKPTQPSTPPKEQKKEKKEKKEGKEKKEKKKKPQTRGIYHTVKRGQTLYRIAKTYDVPQKAIIKANRLTDAGNIKVGQMLFIPGARKVLEVNVPPEPRRPGGQTLPPRNCPPGAVSFMWPVKGRLESTFGIRNNRQHDGIDLSAPDGTPIYAAADGTVIFEGKLGGYGLIIILKHEGNLKSIYAHNKKNLVKKGSIVRKGQKIALLGASGNATGPNLHFEIRCGQTAVNPLPYLPKRGK